MKNARLLGVLWCSLTVLGISVATIEAQRVPTITGDARVDKLLSQMTLEEKINLIDGSHEDPAVYQGQAGYLRGVPRLGVPDLRFADGPPGVLVRHPSIAETATMGIAEATFSRKTSRGKRGRDRARPEPLESMWLYSLVNIDRDLEFERGYNTLGEDPYLTSEIGVAEVKGIQSQHVMAQIKHFVAYDSEAFGTFLWMNQTLHFEVLTWLRSRQPYGAPM